MLINLFDSHKKSASVLAAVLFLMASVFYANAVNNEFVTDDHDIIENYPLIRDVRNIPRFFGVQDTFLSGESTGYYRPLSRLSFLIDYHLWGLNPAGYHIHNIILHAATTVALFFTAQLLFCSRIAFLAGLLFALHPVHVEAVAWATGRNSVLVGLFIVLSFLYYVRFDRGHGVSKRRVYYTLSLFFSALALFAKEFALMIPLLLVLYRISFGRDGLSPAGGSSLFGSSLPRFLRGTTHYFPYLVLIGFYLFARHLVVGAPKGVLLSTLPTNLLLSLKNFFTYIHIMVAPVGLKTTYFVPTGEPFLNARGILSLVTLPLIAASLVVMFKKDKRLFFAVAFYFLFLLPVSGIIAFSQVPVTEHNAYVASLGFCLFCALIADKYVEKYAKITYAFILGVAIFYAYQTVDRNKDWKDDLTLARSAVRENSSSPVSFYFLGNAYMTTGRVEEAVAAYKRSIALNPSFPHSRLSLASIFAERGMWNEAIHEYLEALALMPDNAAAHDGLAFAYFQKGMIDESIEEVKKVLLLHPDDANAKENLSALREEKVLRKQTKLKRRN